MQSEALKPDLLARLEAASGGDRELDALVCKATGAAVEQPDGTWFTAYDGGYRHSINPLPLTTSVDAALALIERALPGVYLKIEVGPVLASVDVLNAREAELGWCNNAPTPALALCIALLKALEASAPQTNRTGE